ncbi:MAG: MaoC family dehydratase N-terminal domain-containing protein [Deltaproteobacteria bacterium]|nr:MaoC family dehydratase N-terminal domain-containing protein [Deltaproteobacteria bacterium]
MNGEPVITEELRNMIGKEAEPEVWEVEKGQIKRLAQAVGDPNPLWQDEDYARQTRYGHIIGSPTFMIDNGLVKFVDKLCKMFPLLANINGGTEIEYYEPMKPGDIITTVAKLSDVQEKLDKNRGRLLFLHVEVSYTNQNGKLVAKCHNIFIRR